MHRAVIDWCLKWASGTFPLVYEFGSRDFNGTARPHIAHERWVGVDLQDGPAVDVVADAATYDFGGRADLCLSVEVFEHTPVWQEILTNMAASCRLGGRVLVTAAGPGRDAHYVSVGPPDEWYENVTLDDLRAAARTCGLVEIAVEYDPVACDVRGWWAKEFG